MRTTVRFLLMAALFRLRDALFPREEVLREAGVRPGWFVVDYGCGPGGCIVPLSESVGGAGMVYALDIHPLAIRSARRIVEKKGLKNVCVAGAENGIAGVSDATVDAAILYDVLHCAAEPEAVLREVHRVLRPGGILSFSDHHLTDGRTLAAVTGLFTLKEKGRKTYTFVKS